MDTRRHTWFLALSGSVALHGAALAALSSWVQGLALPVLQLPPGHAAGMPVIAMALIEPDVEERPRVDQTADVALAEAAALPQPAILEPASRLGALADAAIGAWQALLVRADEQLAEWTAAAHDLAEASASGRSGGAARAEPAPGGSAGVLAGPLATAGNRPPDYPLEARRKRQAGTVILHLVIEADGHVAQAVIAASSGFRLLDEAALDAAMRWAFVPARDGATAVRCQVRLPVAFVLPAPRS